MAFLIFFILHWYLSLFFQSVFHHRYAAHSQFTMNKGWEKFFFIGCFITQGSSYLSAKAYGLLHRLHHAHTDTELDPHSPSYSTNIGTLLLKTRNSYNDIFLGKTVVEEQYHKNLPDWNAFDKLAHNWIARVLWGATYVVIYYFIVTAWWMWLFLPITFALGAIHGLAINWWAHKFGYRNFENEDTSKNILPLDILFWGEGYHNNHHQFPGRPNYAIKWFEVDFGYTMVRLLNKIGIVQLKKSKNIIPSLVPISSEAQIMSA
jgi:stearoyl-CoA desaturase (delta-9 desaturase)